MYKCECGREFSTPQGRGRHKKYCGKMKISIDGGYEYFINEVGELTYIHRYLMESKIGRKLMKGEVVHHKDGNSRNNNIENLELLTESSHGLTHMNNDRKKILQDCNSKLDEEKVKDIRTQLKNGKRVTDLAILYKVDESTIRSARDYETWKNVV